MRRSFDIEENRDENDNPPHCCSSSRHKRSLGVAYISMIIFFNVCGGPWGSEHAGGGSGRDV